MGCGEANGILANAISGCAILSSNTVFTTICDSKVVKSEHEKAGPAVTVLNEVERLRSPSVPSTAYEFSSSQPHAWRGCPPAGHCILQGNCT